MSDFGKVLREIRLSRGMSQEEFAELLDTTKQVISRYEKGQRSPKITAVAKYAEILGVTIEEITGNTPKTPSNLCAPDRVLTHKVRVISHIAAGEPMLAEDEWEMVDAPIKADYALTVVGDSMLPTYMSGDIVYIQAVDDVDDGRTAAVLLDDEATLKHVYHIPNGVQLVSNNPKYPPMIRTFDDCNTIRILGVVVGYTRMYKGGYED